METARGEGEAPGATVHVNSPAAESRKEGMSDREGETAERMEATADLIRAGVRAVLDEEGASDAEISVTLLGDREIRDLHRAYLDRDRITDVLAFPLHEGDEPPLGDVYIGADQAARQARERGLPPEEELLRLAVHGTLHVLGHDHPAGEGRDESEMFRVQEALVRAVLRRERG